MLIASLATGAHEGLLYIRAEYPLAVARIEEALRICDAAGYLGDNIRGSGHALRLRVMHGAGAFVCGEETALLASVEGRRGTPSFRPPYPAQEGLHGCPTLIGNTETLALVPWIVRHGPEAFASLGTARSKGTKVFSLAGKINRGGLIEVPMGSHDSRSWKTSAAVCRAASGSRRYRLADLPADAFPPPWQIPPSITRR